MKVKKLSWSLFYALIYLTGFSACSKDEVKDKVEIIKLYVFEQTGTYQPWGAPAPVEYILVKEKIESEYYPFGLSEITGFVYEKGYEYVLSVEKTTLADPPADTGNIKYKLIEVLSREKKRYFYAVETSYAINAEQKDIIEADLKNNLPVPLNGGYIFNFNDVSIVNENNSVIKSGKLYYDTYIPSEGKVYPGSYKLLTPDNQVITAHEWRFVFENTTIEYDVFYIKYGMQRYVSVRPWLYKDLTEYYKVKYPDAGVRDVVLVQVLTFRP